MGARNLNKEKDSIKRKLVGKLKESTRPVRIREMSLQQEEGRFTEIEMRMLWELMDEGIIRLTAKGFILV